MGTLLVALVALSTAASLQADKSPAELLTIIESPSRGKTEDTQKRFEYILPRFASMCRDTDSDMKVADLLVVLRKILDEAGLAGEEGLLSMSNTLFSLASSLSALEGSDSRNNVDCVDVGTLYVSARQEDMSPKEAKEGIYGAVILMSQMK